MAKFLDLLEKSQGISYSEGAAHEILKRKGIQELDAGDILAGENALRARSGALEMLESWWFERRQKAAATDVGLSKSEFALVLNRVPELAFMLNLASSIPTEEGKLRDEYEQRIREIDYNGNGKLEFRELQSYVLPQVFPAPPKPSAPPSDSPEDQKEAAKSGPVGGEVQEQFAKGIQLFRVRGGKARPANDVAKEAAANTYLATHFDEQGQPSMLYKAAKYEYDTKNGNTVDDLTTGVTKEYDDAKNGDQASYGAIKRALWDRQRAEPKKPTSTRPGPLGIDDGGYKLRPSPVLKF